MNRERTLLRWLPRVALGVCGTLALTSSASAQKEPAATLLPARPVIGPAVVRGSTPEGNLPSFTGAYVASVPAPKFDGSRNDPNGPKQSWAGAKWAGLKESVVGKPNAQDGKNLEPDSRTLAPPNSLLGGPPPSSLFGGPPSPAQGQAQQPPPGIYASPPAYRWYGWGGTTPGANPHAPTGVYPQGSANWYAQTGATPGAFPVTPSAVATEAPSAEPPSYVGKSTVDPQFTVVVAPSKPVETKMPEPKPRFISGPPMPEPRIVARTPFQPPAAAEMPTTPVLPSGQPVAIAASNDGRTLPAEPIAAAPQQELNWQTAGGRGMPMVKEPIFAPPPPPALVAPPAAVDPAWVPASGAPAKPAVPTISVIRGQSEGREPQSLETLVRNACVGRVVRTDVRGTAPGKLTVTFAAASESAAREAAALVAKMPEMKPYEVTFEARIVPR